MSKVARKKEINFLVSRYFPDQSLRAPLPKLEELLGTLLPPREPPRDDESVFPTYKAEIDSEILRYVIPKLLNRGAKKSLYLETLIDSEIFWAKKLQEHIGISFPLTKDHIPLGESYKEQYVRISKLERNSDLILYVDFGEETKEWVRPLITSISPTDYKNIEKIVTKGSIPSLLVFVEHFEALGGHRANRSMAIYLYTRLSLRNLIYLLKNYPRYWDAIWEANSHNPRRDKDYVQYVVENIPEDLLGTYLRTLIQYILPLWLFKYLSDKFPQLIDENYELILKHTLGYGDKKLLKYLLVDNPREEFKKGSIDFFVGHQNLRLLSDLGLFDLINTDALEKLYFTDIGKIYAYRGGLNIPS